MKIVSKKTVDFTHEEIANLYDLYERVFHERSSEQFFYDQFLNTTKGYSYHALALDNGRIVGHNVYVPFDYLKDGIEPFTLVLSIDAMIDPAYQGKGLYRKLLKGCEELALEDNVKLRVGFPNRNSYPIQSKVFKDHDFGTLDIYVLPLRPGARFKWLGFLDCLTMGVSKLMVKRENHRIADNVRFTRNLVEFNRIRYKWFDGDYKIERLQPDITLIYKDFIFGGIPATFIVDFQPRTHDALQKSCRYIVNSNPQTCALFYVGKLPFKAKCMFRIPKFLEPKKVHFVGKIYDKELVGRDGLKVDNWDVNLSSFDLL